MATVEVRPNIRHPHLLRDILLNLLYILIGIMLIAPPAYMYGMIFANAANFQDFPDVEVDPWVYFELPDYSTVEEGSTTTLYLRISNAVPFGEIYDDAVPCTVVRNPARIFDDGTTVALVSNPYMDTLIYLLPDGRFLMAEQSGDRIDTVENTPLAQSSVDIPDDLQRAIINDCKLNFENWNDYFVLKRLYDDYLAGDYTPGWSFSSSVIYYRDIDIRYVSDRYLFVEAFYGRADDIANRHNVVYDRVTGNRVKVPELFCVSEEQAKQRLVDELLRPRDLWSEMSGPTEPLSDTAYAEALAALDLAGLRFYKKGVYLNLPAGALTDYPDRVFNTSCSYASIADILKDCVLPTDLRSWQLVELDAFTLDDGRTVDVYYSDKNLTSYGLFIDGVWVLSAPADVTPGRPLAGGGMVDPRYKVCTFNAYDDALEIFDSLPPSVQSAFCDFIDAHYREWFGDSIVAQTKYIMGRYDAYGYNNRGLLPLAASNLGDLRVAVENDSVVVFDHRSRNYVLRQPDPPRELPYEYYIELDYHTIIVNKHTDPALDAEIGDVAEGVLRLFDAPPDDLLAVALSRCEYADDPLAVDSLREAVFSGNFTYNYDGVSIPYRRTRPASMNIDDEFIDARLDLDYNDVMPLLKPWARPGVVNRPLEPGSWPVVEASVAVMDDGAVVDRCVEYDGAYDDYLLQNGLLLLHIGGITVDIIRPDDDLFYANLPPSPAQTAALRWVASLDPQYDLTAELRAAYADYLDCDSRGLRYHQHNIFRSVDVRIFDDEPIYIAYTVTLPDKSARTLYAEYHPDTEDVTPVRSAVARDFFQSTQVTP